MQPYDVHIGDFIADTPGNITIQNISASADGAIDIHGGGVRKRCGRRHHERIRALSYEECSISSRAASQSRERAPRIVVTENLFSRRRRSSGVSVAATCSNIAITQKRNMVPPPLAVTVAAGATNVLVRNNPGPRTASHSSPRRPSYPAPCSRHQ